MSHPYLGLTQEEINSMLMEMGIEKIEELYRDIPSKFFLKRPLQYSQPMSEEEVRQHIKKILSKNKVANQIKLFIGGGAWFHLIPSAVKEIVRRSEFLTSYTPYQPEVSQGMLQALFEYQSLMAELLDIEVVNSSMYDWATALGEAFRMVSRVTKRSKILYPQYISPERLKVAETYTEPTNIMMVEYIQNRIDGSVDLEDLKKKIDQDTAAVYIEYPSYLGFIPLNIREVGEIAHDHKALFIIGVDPTALGVFESPGKLGADIVVGEGQPLGMPVNFGGPLLGIMGCRMERELVHQLPGRLIGMTVTHKGERAYTMILQAREQHIKREKATSNICTNQALCALTAAVYLSLLGKNGIRILGEQILARTKYLISRLSKIVEVEAPLFKSIHFKEFTYRVVNKQSREVLRRLFEKNIVGGISIDGMFRDVGDAILTCVTEIHSKEDLDYYVDSLKEVVER
ncbi:MAG: aminomethyl-transferring glycine dehydrogenase subunit GcvPA [Aigarchaeota archaeon]|nr:aminomethyl-transferring glycine dehydrogenase subunit GcvPA [Aigarchaeota archaeon]MCX8193240.1 aminomethyl-transferring glycine dehydrogenase subunit GcvPA [Nitrososphaeria archaeon]MDW7986380.1 aminomethyl-transferring glycine dehydrogenase subunit GcvPA [Nitrososphaerota archaeon]